MRSSLAAHTARPLRRRPPPMRRLLVRTKAIKDILAFVCEVIARRIPQVPRD